MTAGPPVRRTSGPTSGPASTHGAADVCAIDFGTSNSAIALPTPDGVRLVALEAGEVTMPTAVFYLVEGLAAHEDPQRLHGRAALAAYVDGAEGRLMRSMKSILGSTLADQSTDVGGGRSVRYLDVIESYLQHLKLLAERDVGGPLRRLVLGRPVRFVDDDDTRDAAAQSALERAARAVGFTDVSFQFEPIAAAFDHEARIDAEQLVLVADIGGGTSDFALVRVGPARRQRADRRDDILAHHGVHVAGTDFDRHVELARVLPACGYRARGPGGREVPSKVYFDLATWHLINTVYVPSRVGELARMKSFYDDPVLHARLMTVVRDHLGHALAGRAEAAKIDVATHGRATIDLSLIERGLHAELGAAEAMAALDADLERIARAAGDTLRQAGIAPGGLDALYVTGGSTGLRPLVERIARACGQPPVLQGDRLSSVAQGLGLHAARLHA